MIMSPKSFSIKKWSQDDQPREKLRDKGARLLLTRLPQQKTY